MQDYLVRRAAENSQEESAVHFTKMLNQKDEELFEQEKELEENTKQIAFLEENKSRMDRELSQIQNKLEKEISRNKESLNTFDKFKDTVHTLKEKETNIINELQDSLYQIVILPQ